MNRKSALAMCTMIALLLLFTVIGSLWDYEIAKACYWGEVPSENFFGILFAFIGVIPTFVGWSFLGACILSLSKGRDVGVGKRRWLIALSVLLFVLSFFYFCNTLLLVNQNAFSVPWWIAYPIGIAVIVGAAFLGFRLSASSDQALLLRTVLRLTAVSIVTMALIMSAKGIMDRPRFRWVQEAENADYFRNWWESGAALKASVGTDAVSDEFSSFPSGHSAYSMFAVFLFPMFAELCSALRKHRTLLFFGGVLWWGLTAFSRMTVGAHYLTDVCIAGLVTVLAYGIVRLGIGWIEKKTVVKP